MSDDNPFSTNSDALSGAPPPPPKPRPRKSKEREEFADIAPATMPKPISKVPRKPTSRTDRKKSYQKYGKAPPWRFPPELIDAVAVAAKENDVRPKELAEFLVRAGLDLLARERIELPLDENEDKPASKVIKDYPNIPDVYQP